MTSLGNDYIQESVYGHHIRTKQFNESLFIKNDFKPKKAKEFSFNECALNVLLGCQVFSEFSPSFPICQALYECLHSAGHSKINGKGTENGTKRGSEHKNDITHPYVRVLLRVFEMSTSASSAPD
ncbi:hypothetical protein PROFUN_16316 [Planoprotostelium fungivorum]|uniref:Uncharacterized protein n=1 Tax=Planoprotostelium fungivorum TaxID=1890364 RepID=A0A2P6MRB6_9EUKA|nr:hypothetical protein PROFUN_16316 [Planoprotostelium fungivorum]